MAKALMFQGTSSSAGKTIISTALCRILKQDGFRVAPFKAQNMSGNSFLTASGDEISIAQAIQAEAAGVLPTPDMNPILLKPCGEMMSEVVIQGKTIGKLHAGEYRSRHLPEFRKAIICSYRRLSENYDVVVIEGAGSPVEVNLKDRDIVNMKVAKMAHSPVFLVADISLGGVFAAIVGTLELLEEGERDMVAGFIINKFRGDISLLEPGLDFLEKKTGKPVLGVVPYVQNLSIAEEDLAARSNKAGLTFGSTEDCCGKGNPVRCRYPGNSKDTGNIENVLCKHPGKTRVKGSRKERREAAYDRLAQVVRQSLDIGRIYSIARLGSNFGNGC